ncbi:MAG: tetratricopeptide repeat protein [Candidatus Omnitrophica bacterium]|nr:tetratricopeptide repeat protein [Candidatus Omnitrophota bacterium]
MRHIRLAIFFLACFFSQAQFSYALDWQKLNARGRAITLSEAQKAVRQNPGSTEALYVLAIADFEKHKDANAGKLFQRMLVLEPRCREAKWGAAEVLRRQHKMAASENLLKEILRKTPDFAPASLSLSYINYIRMDLPRALRLADDVLDRGRDRIGTEEYVEALLLAGGVRGLLAHYGGPVAKITNGLKVLPYLKKAEKLRPQDARVQFGLGSFYLLAPAIAGGDLAKAQSYLQSAVKSDPLLADAYVRLGQVYLRQGQRKTYQDLLHKALSVDPQNELARDILSRRCRFICIEK